jgi:PmbA protein
MSEFLDYAVKKCIRLGVSQAEVFSTNDVDTSVVIEKKQVKIGQVTRDRGMGIRVLVKKEDGASTGFSYVTDFSRKAIAEAAKKAVRTAKVKKADKDLKSFQEKAKIPRKAEMLDGKILKTDPSDLIKIATSMLEESSMDSRVSTISGGVYSGVGEVSIVNSLGISATYKSTAFGGHMYVVAEQGGSVGVGWEGHSSSHYESGKLVAAAREAASIAIKQLNPKPLSSGVYDIVVEQDGLADLLMNTLVQQTRADLAQKNQSPLAGKVGSQVASEMVTFFDDPTIPRSQGSKPFDTEGCPTKMRPIIEKGVFRTFLHNSYTAKKENVENTGNASRYIMFGTRPEYALEPGIGPHNLVLKPDKGEKEDLIREVKNGILVKGFIGAHTSNVQSGDFSLALDSVFRIESGDLTYPVKQAMIGGNMPSILKQVRLVASNSKEVTMGPRMTLNAPTILIEKVTVST